MATLHIEIVEAKLTRDTDTFGKMDPYCILKAGKQTHKTKVLDGAGKEPKWNEGFDIDAKKAGASIKIEVKDEDVTNSDDIGEANIKVAELSAEGGFDKWVDIKYKGKKAGQIHVVVAGEKKAAKKKDGGSAAQAPEKKAPAKKKAEPKKKEPEPAEEEEEEEEAPKERVYNPNLYGNDLPAGAKDELVCVYAALFLKGSGVELSEEKMNKIITASGNKVEPYWPGLFAKALKDQDLDALMANVGGPAPAGGAAAGGAAAADAPAAEAEGKKKEEKPAEEEEEDVDMGGLFGDDGY